MNKTIGIINIDKEPPVVQQAFLTAKADMFFGDKELIWELSELLAKHSVKSLLKIQNQIDKGENDNGK